MTLYSLKVRYGVADPSIFIRDGGPSISEAMFKSGIIWQKADNKREPGWQQIRRRLVGVDGEPLLYFLESCEDTIRTLPLLQHDEKKAEDLDSEGEDHAADEVRYACMSRPWVVDSAEKIELPFPQPPGQLTFNDALRVAKSKRLREANATTHCL